MSDFFDEYFTTGSINGAMICVNITILDDSILEENETFTMTLTTADSDVIIGTTMAAIIIIDDDS